MDCHESSKSVFCAATREATDVGTVVWAKANGETAANKRAEETSRLERMAKGYQSGWNRGRKYSAEALPNLLSKDFLLHCERKFNSFIPVRSKFEN